MKAKILADVQICISVPLILTAINDINLRSWHSKYITFKEASQIVKRRTNTNIQISVNLATFLSVSSNIYCKSNLCLCSACALSLILLFFWLPWPCLVTSSILSCAYFEIKLFFFKYLIFFLLASFCLTFPTFFALPYCSSKLIFFPLSLPLALALTFPLAQPTLICLLPCLLP